eukprot:27843-Eustigmatos_ZCMA.PRE.1
MMQRRRRHSSGQRRRCGYPLHRRHDACDGGCIDGSCMCGTSVDSPSSGSCYCLSRVSSIPLVSIFVVR